MKSQVVKNQHIVPKRHLKQFSILGDKNKVKGFDCDRVEILKKDQSIRSICSGYFHYALKPGEEDDYSQQVEKAFGNLEDWYGKNIERIEQLLLKKATLDTADRFGISCLVSNFYFRGISFRDEMTNASKELTDWFSPIISEHIYNKISKEYPGIFDNNYKKVVNEITKTELHKEASKTCYTIKRSFDVGFANTLTHKKWEVLINNSDYPFITSDEAVIDLINSQMLDSFRFKGAWLLKTQIFNLSPKISIIFSFPFTEDMHGHIEYRNITTSKTDIFKQNLHYVNFSHKYAYSQNIHFFEDVVMLNKKNEK